MKISELTSEELLEIGEAIGIRGLAGGDAVQALQALVDAGLFKIKITPAEITITAPKSTDQRTIRVRRSEIKRKG